LRLEITVKRVPTLVAVALSLSTSCADPKEVATLKKQASELETSVEALKASVKQLEEKRSFDDLLKNFDSVAYLTPGTAGYSVIETDIGRVTVMLADVQPYANGSRITLQFGNLLSATIDGAKAKLEWGSVDDKGNPRNDSAHSRQIDFSNSLRAGAWTNVPVVLEGVPPTDLGFVRVRDMTHTGIKLAR
jgi:hypothetical protein